MSVLELAFEFEVGEVLESSEFHRSLSMEITEERGKNREITEVDLHMS